jgi:hypothetical protein
MGNLLNYLLLYITNKFDKCNFNFMRNLLKIETIEH